MRAVIYNRVSLDKRNERRSVQEQEAENRAVVERHGWDLVGVYTDNDVGASRWSRDKGRPDWERVVEGLNNGEFDVLVVWELSRAGRDRRVSAALIEGCIDNRVMISEGGKIFDPSDPDDGFNLDLQFALAVRESGVTRKRVVRSMKSGAEKGRPHGKIPFGYVREYDEKSGALLRQVPDPDEAALIREAADRVLEGEALNAVAEDWTARGIPAPRAGTLFTRTVDREEAERQGWEIVRDIDAAKVKARVPASDEWDLTQVRRLLTLPTYAGMRVHKGEVVGDADWPAILDEDTWSALQRKLTNPRRRSSRGRAVKHLLSGIAKCGVCGSRVGTQKNRNHRAYLCLDGFHVSRKEETVDRYVVETIVQRLSLPNALKSFLSVDNTSEGNDAQEELDELRERLSDLYEAVADRRAPNSALETIAPKWEARIKELERETTSVEVPSVLVDAAGPDIEERWEGFDLVTKRAIIDSFVIIEILPVGRGKRTFDPDSVRITPKVA